jgi:hypothetical protein
MFVIAATLILLGSLSYVCPVDYVVGRTTPGGLYVELKAFEGVIGVEAPNFIFIFPFEWGAFVVAVWPCVAAVLWWCRRPRRVGFGVL